MYSEKVIERFRNPKFAKKLADADGVGEVGNLTCGDIMRVYIKVNDNIISEISYQTYGCAAAIVSTEYLCEIALNKKLEDAMKITHKQVLEKMGVIPMEKIHCSVLADDALKEAIYDYYKKNNIDIPEFLEEEHERIVSAH